MKKYIDLDTAFEKLELIKQEVAQFQGSPALGVLLACLRLASIPPEDVVKVVRCKDCRSFQICQLAKTVGENGYCSKGEIMEIRHGI